MRDPAAVEITVVSNGQLWTFRCQAGQESKLLDALVELVNRDVGFTWLDAVVVSHQLGRRLARGMKAVILAA